MIYLFPLAQKSLNNIKELICFKLCLKDIYQYMRLILGGGFLLIVIGEKAIKEMYLLRYSDVIHLTDKTWINNDEIMNEWNYDE